MTQDELKVYLEQKLAGYSRQLQTLEPRTQTFKIMSALAAFIRELLDLMEAQP